MKETVHPLVVTTSLRSVPIVVVMGASGCGKSTIGSRVAQLLAVPFVDSDSLHSPSSVAKMAAGTPLTDEDRLPWLGRVGQLLADARPAGLITACSALKRQYREAILHEAPEVLFVHLDGSPGTLRQRLEGRRGHFMPPALLASQLASLEPLDNDEPGFAVDIESDVDAIAATIVAQLTRAGGNQTWSPPHNRAASALRRRGAPQ